MSIDFTTLQGLTIPEGVVTQITDESGRVIWAVANNAPVVLQVEKITSDTYAGETTYTGEQFILLDIYPKTNGTVNVTYDGLTKTITDTSGAAEPNAQQVFFGTFNGVTDSVATAASGELTIEGEYYSFGCGSFNVDKSQTERFVGITSIESLGVATQFPSNAFWRCAKLSGTVTIPKTASCGEFMFRTTGIEEIIIPEGVKKLGYGMISQCDAIKKIHIPSSVISFGTGGFVYSGIGSANVNNPIVVDSKNTKFKVDGNCLISDKALLSGYKNSVIPEYIESIGKGAFFYCTGLTSINIPASVTNIAVYAFGNTGLTSINIPASVTNIAEYAFSGCTSLISATFENPTGWYTTTEDDEGNTTEIVLDLSDAANNATLLYSAKRLYRK